MRTRVLTSHVLGPPYLPIRERAHLYLVVSSPMTERLSVRFLSPFHFQLFGYLAIAAASLLIVLRMYLRNFAMPPSIAHVYR